MLLDIGAGILLGLWFGPSHSTFFNTGFGVLFTLLPDADLFVYLLLKKTKLLELDKRLRDHRELFHYPLIYIVLGIILVSVIYPSLLPLFIVGSLEQFIHDSIGAGWGIPWLYPISKKYYKFIYQLDLFHANQPQKLVWIWSKQEQDQLTDKYGDPEWHRHIKDFTQVAPIWTLVELSVFVIALLVLVFR